MFLLDTANAAIVKSLNDILTIDGVTTNPTIITKTGQVPEVVLQDLVLTLDPDQKLFVQVIKSDVEGIMEEARKIVALRPNTYPKIPVTRPGLMAIKQCAKEGIDVLATAIYSASEGWLAAKNGARWLAPYVNRMSNYGDGVDEVITLQSMLENQGLDAGIIAASFKNTRQVVDLIANGVESVTVSPEIAQDLISHPGTTIAVGEFTINWQTEYGRNELFAKVTEEQA